MRKIGIAIIALIIFFPIIPVFPQEVTIGEAAQQIVEIVIRENEQVHVKHNVLQSDSTIQVDFINGTISNIEVADIEGNAVQSGTLGAGNPGIVIFSSKQDIIVEYDLDDVLELKEGFWSWDYSYHSSTEFIFPNNVNLILVNERPIFFGEKRARISCHGCEATIQYVKDELFNLKEVQWEDRKFVLGILSLSDISSFNFDQPTKKISLEVTEDNQRIIVNIPLELLWRPYEVFLNDERVFVNEFYINETHAGISIRHDTSGTIEIIGTTVVPEFPIFAPLLVGIAAVIILQFRNRLNLR